MPEQDYKIIKEGPASYMVEGFFRNGAMQRFRSASGFKTEADARQWAYDQQAKDDGAAERLAAAAMTPGAG